MSKSTVSVAVNRPVVVTPPIKDVTLTLDVQTAACLYRLCGRICGAGESESQLREATSKIYKAFEDLEAIDRRALPVLILNDYDLKLRIA